MGIFSGLKSIGIINDLLKEVEYQKRVIDTINEGGNDRLDLIREEKSMSFLLDQIAKIADNSRSASIAVYKFNNQKMQLKQIFLILIPYTGGLDAEQPAFFSEKEKEAFDIIEKINRRMKIIRYLIVNYGDSINATNGSSIAAIFVECRDLYAKYQKYIFKNLMDYERGMFRGATVDCWNGEQTGVIMWETYFENMDRAMTPELKAKGFLKFI